MSLIIVTPPAARPVDINEVKQFLRVDGSDEDTLIGMLIDAATEAIQYHTRRQLINCTRRKAWIDWKPRYELPFSPLQSVTSVEYRNTAGNWVTLAGSNYEAETQETPGTIRFNTSNLPDLYEDDGTNVMDRVRCTYVSGYGSAHTAVPANLKTALMSLVATRYTYREELQDQNLKDISTAFAQYLASHRVIRF